MNLVRDEDTSGTTVTPAVTLSDLFGASFAAHALPNSGPTTTVANQQSLSHPDVVPSLPIGFLDASNAENGQVSVEGDRLLRVRLVHLQQRRRQPELLGRQPVDEERRAAAS